MPGYLSKESKMKKTCRKCKYSKVTFDVLECSKNVIYPCFPIKTRMQIRLIDAAVTCKHFKFNYFMIFPLAVMAIKSLVCKTQEGIQKKLLEPKKKPTKKFSTKDGKPINPPTTKKRTSASKKRTLTRKRTSASKKRTLPRKRTSTSKKKTLPKKKTSTSKSPKSVRPRLYPKLTSPPPPQPPQPVRGRSIAEFEKRMKEWEKRMKEWEKRMTTRMTKQRLFVENKLEGRIRELEINPIRRRRRTTTYSGPK
jgi:hypothetical protein